MSQPDPIDFLRTHNPVDEDYLPSASLARVRASVREHVMTSTETTDRRAPRFLPVGLAVGAAIVLALAFVAGNGLVPGVGNHEPTGPISGGIGMCVEQYSLETLANRAFAFDGTVSATSGDSVTFTVNAAFRGIEGKSITLKAPGMTGSAVTSAGGPSLAVGQRYLVAGDDTFVWGCGFTQNYDADVAAAWTATVDN
jgi:hypothetical protein